MVNIRTIKIDFTSENTLPESSFLGYQGEHNATALSIIPPEEMTACEEIATYKVAFELNNCRHTRSEALEKASPVEVVLSAQITSSKEISIQLEGYGADGNLVVKSPKITKLTFDDSVGGVSVDYSAEGGTAADITANTLARHKHSNADILDNLSEDENGILLYNGEKIGQSNDDELSEESENAVKNKVVTAKFNEVEESIKGVSETVLQNSGAIGELAESQNETDERLIEAEGKLHEHANSDVLEKLSEGEGGKVLYNGEEIKQTVDSALSDNSENPVQNKVVKSELDGIMEKFLLLLPLKSEYFPSDWENGLIDDTEITSGTLYFDIYKADFEDTDKNIQTVFIRFDGKDYALTDEYLIGSATATVYDTPVLTDSGAYRIAEIKGLNSLSTLYKAISSYTDEAEGFTVYFKI